MGGGAHVTHTLSFSSTASSPLKVWLCHGTGPYAKAGGGGHSVAAVSLCRDGVLVLARRQFPSRQRGANRDRSGEEWAGHSSADVLPAATRRSAVAIRMPQRTPPPLPRQILEPDNGSEVVPMVSLRSGTLVRRRADSAMVATSPSDSDIGAEEDAILP